VLNKPLFNVEIEDIQDCEEKNVVANDSMENDYAENDGSNFIDRNYINSFKLQQEKLCNTIFGEKFLQSTEIDQLPNIFKDHVHRSNNPAKRIKLDLYDYIADRGLSRDDGDALLKLFNRHNPSLRTTKSFKSMETGIKKEVDSLFDYAEIEIPWIDSWNMEDMQNCPPPMKIYVRSMFQVISYMLVDPELMLHWRNHVQLSFQRAVDRDGNRVYSNVMSSPWAKHLSMLKIQVAICYR